MINNQIQQLLADDSLIKKLVKYEPVLWLNQQYDSTIRGPLSCVHVEDAIRRLERFAPYIAKAFPETSKQKGIIESPLLTLFNMKEKHVNVKGDLLLKADNELPISGSIKARGGIYEVLKHAEHLALSEGILNLTDDYSKLFNQQAFFLQYSIAVGSTGNLGLSIGIMGAKLGFRVYVHMSSEAKKWKKELLKQKGVQVIEHTSDFSAAVAEGRRQAESDPTMYFIDDEHSEHLFLGYAVAAFRLKKQLEEKQISISQEYPLFVYLPCGVGGGPGGITFGLKQVFGEHVHCFFAEPTHAPAMLLGLRTGLHEKISVQDIGIELKTEADGLAVGRPSQLVGHMLEKAISGVYTVSDRELYEMMHFLKNEEGIFLEPSALAGFLGPKKILQSMYSEQVGITNMSKVTHLVWGTGGSMVPDEIQQQYLHLAKKAGE
ncbi:D-serine ammonia-lyase [Cytobacillus kochii]|uniref:D-serine ammonia-lyase n=1 Tax=Cytobacillus kochii TaxID=859143 RepID=UPI00277DBF21|nr:D-serine ammonia-lyase [Cytobacillus kochii]MDQ0185503.1 D-serine dehydratase [Cytobacillus kochii]